jgi:hypothetical protein
MSWMKMHKAVLDIAVRLVHQSSPVYGKVTLHLPAISCIKASLHHMVERRMEDIHVAHEFPDVFSDDLSGMPPISMAPYKMSQEELLELKI